MDVDVTAGREGCRCQRLAGGVYSQPGGHSGEALYEDVKKNGPEGDLGVVCGSNFKNCENPTRYVYNASKTDPTIHFFLFQVLFLPTTVREKIFKKRIFGSVLLVFQKYSVESGYVCTYNCCTVRVGVV